MKKLGILIVIIIILFTIFLIMKKDNKQNQVQNNNIVINNYGTSKMDVFVEELKEKGITLTNKEEITSEQINENGYIYELNGEKIEIYNVSQEKIKNIIEQSKSDYEITIRTMQGEKINAIYYDEILILNCIKNSDKILEVL